MNQGQREGRTAPAGVYGPWKECGVIRVDLVCLVLPQHRRVHWGGSRRMLWEWGQGWE